MSHDRVFHRKPDGLPAVHGTLAYHFENESFVRFLEQYALSLGVTILDDTVLEVKQDEAGIAGLVRRWRSRSSASRPACFATAPSLAV